MKRALFSVVIAAACQGPGQLNTLAPRLVADQSELHLGPTDIGVSVVTTASFSNPSDGEADLRAVIEGGAGAFELLDTTASATHEHPALVRVRFTPAAPGDLRATLVVQHDAEPGDDGTRTLRVALTGTGNTLPACDDHNACTADLADTSLPGGCAFIPIRGGCDDGDACTLDDTCLAGICVGRALDCGDGIDCTADTCSEGTCAHTPLDALCDDGDGCTEDTCMNDGCAHAVKPTGSMCGAPSCSALPVCVDGECVESPAPDGFPCEDGNVCSQGEVCHAGSCVAPIDWNGVGAVQLIQDEYPPLQDLTRGIVDHWPLALDGVFDEDGSNEPPGFIFTRGVDRDALAQCLDQPQLCKHGPTCAQGGLHRMHLTMSWVMGAQPRLSTTLDVDAVHRDVEQLLGMSSPGFATPPGSVLASAPAQLNGNIYGAALISYASQCDCPTILPGDSSDAACVPAGNALVLFVFDGFGLDPIWVDWLSSSQGGSPIPPTIATNEPLLSVATSPGQFAISVVTGSTLVCGGAGGCIHRVTVRTSFLALDALGFLTHSRDSSRTVDMLDRPDRMHTTIVDGTLWAALLSPDVNESPPCLREGAATRSVLVGALDGDPHGIADRALARHALDAWFAPVAVDVPELWTYEQDYVSSDGSCAYQDSVARTSLRTGDGSRETLRTTQLWSASTSVAGLGLTTMGPVAAYLTSIDVAGAHVVGGANGGWLGEQDIENLSLLPGVAPRVGRNAFYALVRTRFSNAMNSVQDHTGLARFPISCGQ